jgi:hypothetical protein
VMNSCSDLEGSLKSENGENYEIRTSLF